MFSATLWQWLNENGLEIPFVVRTDSPLHSHLILYKPNLIYPIKCGKYLSPSLWLLIRQLIKQHNCHILHTFKSSDIFHAAWAAIGKSRWDLSLVHHLQMLPKHSRRDPLHHLSYRRVDRLITITHQIADRAGKLWPIPNERITPLYYGIDLDRFQPSAKLAAKTRMALGIGPHQIVLTIAGQVCPIKGQLLVAQAFKQIAKNFPDTILLIAGAPAPGSTEYVRQLKHFIASANLTDRVKMLGFCDNIPEILNASDVFVSGSTAEPFGFVIVEAMASGCVVAASRAGGVPEIITSGHDGFLYEANDCQDLIHTLRQILTLTPRHLTSLRSTARTTVVKRFHRERFLHDMIALYNNLPAAQTRA